MSKREQNLLFFRTVPCILLTIFVSSSLFDDIGGAHVRLFSLAFLRIFFGVHFGEDTSTVLNIVFVADVVVVVAVDFRVQ